MCEQREQALHSIEAAIRAEQREAQMLQGLQSKAVYFVLTLFQDEKSLKTKRAASFISS